MEALIRSMYGSRFASELHLDTQSHEPARLIEEGNKSLQHQAVRVTFQFTSPHC
jgi:hypothetical protein